jgi:phospholipase/carboxylesterase
MNICAPGWNARWNRSGAEMYQAARTTGAPGAPLIITCHGTGGDERQFHDVASQLMPDAHVVSPRGDVSEQGALRYFRRTGEGVFDMADLARATAKMAAFLNAEAARTGAARRIGLGYSNGANILAATAAAHGAGLTDLILLHPLIPYDPGVQPALKGARVLITAGRRDPICPPHLTERLAQWFVAQGAELQLAWHDGGHEIGRSELPALQRFLA